MKDDRIYFLHIRDAINRIQEYSSGGKQAFLADAKTQDAVVRNLEIIGEAVKNISSPLKTEYPDIPWKQIAGMRDKMIHEYFGVDLEIVWEVVSQRIPELESQVKRILEASSNRL